MRCLLGRFIKPTTITDRQLAPNAVTVNQLEDQAVTSPKIGSGIVETLHFASGSVTTDKLDNGAVISEHLTQSSREYITENLQSMTVASGEVVTAQSLVELINGQLVSGSRDWAYDPIPLTESLTEALYTTACALSPTTVLAVYQDTTNSKYGTAIVISISDTITLGTPAVFASAEVSFLSVSALSPEKAIVSYRDHSNSFYGTACILSITNLSITPGSPIVYASTGVEYPVCCALSATSALVVYCHVANAYYGTGCVLTIENLTITPGDPAVFEEYTTNYLSVCRLTDTKALVVHRHNGMSTKGAARVLSIVGTSLSPGTQAFFDTNSISNPTVCSVSSTKAIVSYNQASDQYGRAVVLTVTNTTISVGTAITLDTSPDSNHRVTLVQVSILSETRAIVAYISSDYGLRTCHLRIVGTTLTRTNPPTTIGGLYTNATIALTPSLVVVLVATGNQDGATVTIKAVHLSYTGVIPYTPATFDRYGRYLYACALAEDKVVVVYHDQTASNYCTACALSISGSTITYGTPVVYNSYNLATSHTRVCALSSTRAVVICLTASNTMGACVLSVSGTQITANSFTTIEPNSNYVPSIIALSSNTCLVSYHAYESGSGGDSHGYAQVLSISDTTVTAEGRYLIGSTGILYWTELAFLTPSKALCMYKPIGSLDCRACVLSIDGTTITSGAETVVYASTAVGLALTSLSDTQALVVCQGPSASYSPQLFLLSISGNSIAVTSSEYLGPVPYQILNRICALNTTQALVFSGVNNLGDGYISLVSVTDTTISINSLLVVSDRCGHAAALCTLGSGKALVAYDNGLYYYNSACVLSVRGVTSSDRPTYWGMALESKAGEEVGQVVELDHSLYCYGLSGLVQDSYYYATDNGLLSTAKRKVNPLVPIVSGDDYLVGLATDTTTMKIIGRQLD